MKIDFFGNGTCTHCSLTKHELQYLMDFHHESEALWFNKDSDLQEEIDMHLQDVPKEKHAEIVDDYSFNLHLNQQKYPAIHRSSILITTFNLLENQLNTLCKILAPSITNSLKLADIHGKGVTRAIIYLSKVANFDLSNFSDEKRFIACVNTIRNAIVHSNGYLPNDEKNGVYRFISDEICISGSVGGEVIIHDGFIDRFIGVLITFFTKLDLEVQAHIKRHNERNYPN